MKARTKIFVMSLMVILPFATLADIAMPPRVVKTTYVHRAHRIGYEVLKAECDSIGAVDCICRHEDLHKRDSNQKGEYGFGIGEVLIGVVLVCLGAVVLRCVSSSKKLLIRIGRWVLAAACLVASVALCRMIWIEVKPLLLGISAEETLVQEQRYVKFDRIDYADETVYVEEDGWLYVDHIAPDYLLSCVSEAEGLRTLIQERLTCAAAFSNSNDVIGILKVSPDLLKKSKGILIEVLAALVRAPDEDVSYWKDENYWREYGREVFEKTIESRNPNVGRCSKCGHEGYLPTHQCGALGAKYSEQRFKAETE